MVQTPPTIMDVSTAVLNSVLPVNATLRPVWKSSSTGEPVMIRVGVGTRGRGHGHVTLVIIIMNSLCTVINIDISIRYIHTGYTQVLVAMTTMQGIKGQSDTG